MSHIDEDQIVFGDAEQARWQDKIEARLIQRTGIAPSQLDVSGDDSGDPLDWTLAQIGRAINYVDEKRQEVIQAANAATDGLIESLRIAHAERDAARAMLCKVMDSYVDYWRCDEGGDHAAQIAAGLRPANIAVSGGGYVPYTERAGSAGGDK